MQGWQHGSGPARGWEVGGHTARRFDDEKRRWLSASGIGRWEKLGGSWGGGEGSQGILRLIFERPSGRTFDRAALE